MNDFPFKESIALPDADNVQRAHVITFRYQSTVINWTL